MLRPQIHERLACYTVSLAPGKAFSTVPVDARFLISYAGIVKMSCHETPHADGWISWELSYFPLAMLHQIPIAFGPAFLHPEERRTYTAFFLLQTFACRETPDPTSTLSRSQPRSLHQIRVLEDPKMQCTCHASTGRVRSAFPGRT